MKTTKLGTQIKNLADQFERESWLSPKEVEKLQFEKLERLAGYCEKQSPLFAKRLRESKLTPATLATPEGLKRFPLLTRRDLQTQIEDLYCKAPPAAHFPVAELSTSGSTGEPVVVKRTAASQVILMAFGLLEHLWNQRDHSARLGIIRAVIAEYKRVDTWGQPLNLVYDTGPSLGMPITTDVKILVQWLKEFEANHVLLYPNTLAAITQYCQQHQISIPSLTDIRTMSETLTEHVRKEAETYFGCKISDTYSSQEMGVIALQCPVSGLYHCAAPNVIVEVLNAQGEVCKPGEIGRLTLTDLFNLATPLVRYDIGDYAEVSEPCPCGRGWPTLKRILGRERNLICMPDGSRHWPLAGLAQYRETAPINQYQLIQREIERIEVRLVTQRPFTFQEENDLRVHMQDTLRHPFTIDLVYFDEKIPVGANGKFEEFVCAIGPHPSPLPE